MDYFSKIIYFFLFLINLIIELWEALGVELLINCQKLQIDLILKEW
jgi:hypothetical protein